MSKPITVHNDTDTDVVFRDRGGVRSVIPAGGTADVHHDDLEYLRSRGVVQDRSGESPDRGEKPDKVTAVTSTTGAGGTAP